MLRDAAGEALAVVEAVWLQRVRLPGGAEAASVPRGPRARTARPERRGAGGLDLGPALDAARRRDAALDLDETSALLEGFCAAAAHAALTAAPAATGRTDLARSLLRTWQRTGWPPQDRPDSRLLPAPDLPAALEIWRQVLLEQPGLAPDLAWLALAAERLPGALAGDRLRSTDPADDAVARPAAGKRRAGAAWPGAGRGRLRLRRRPGRAAGRCACWRSAPAPAR